MSSERQQFFNDTDSEDDAQQGDDIAIKKITKTEVERSSDDDWEYKENDIEWVNTPQQIRLAGRSRSTLLRLLRSY